jgi:hypothetical protein
MDNNLHPREQYISNKVMSEKKNNKNIYYLFTTFPYSVTLYFEVVNCNWIELQEQRSLKHLAAT